MRSQADDLSETSGRPKATVRRFLKLAMLIFGLVIGGVAIAGLFVGERADLPFDYEGFD